MKYVELNLFPEEEEEIQKDSDSNGSKKNRSAESNEYDYAVKRKYDFTNLFERLSKSAFRSRFHLSQKDREYITEKGLATIRKHAEDFVAKRLAIYCPTCHRLLLPRLLLQMASYTRRKTADKGRTAICGGGVDGVDSHDRFLIVGHQIRAVLIEQIRQ